MFLTLSTLIYLIFKYYYTWNHVKPHPPLTHHHVQTKNISYQLNLILTNRYRNVIVRILVQGQIQDFKLRGVLKIIAKIFWVFRVKNHDFTQKKNHIFSNFRRDARRVRAGCASWIRPCSKYKKSQTRQVSIKRCMHLIATLKCYFYCILSSQI